MKVLAAFIAVPLFTVAGCAANHSPNEVLDPDFPAYAGLPQDVVAERLADPGFLEVLESYFPADEWVGTVQANVAFTQYCRDALAVYEAWDTDPGNPEAPILVVPDAVASQVDFHLATDAIVIATTEAIASGDPEALREQLIMNGACNVVPAAPDSSTTIEEVLAQH